MQNLPLQNLPLEERNFLTFFNNVSTLRLGITYPIFIISRIPVWFLIFVLFFNYGSISFEFLTISLAAIFVARSYIEHLITNKNIGYFLVSRLFRFILEIFLISIILFGYGNFIFHIEKPSSMDILLVFAALALPLLIKWNTNQSPWLGYHLKAIPLFVVTALWYVIALSQMPIYIKLFAFILIQVTELYNLVYESHIGNIEIKNQEKGLIRFIPNIFRSKKYKLKKDSSKLYNKTAFETISSTINNDKTTFNERSKNLSEHVLLNNKEEIGNTAFLGINKNKITKKVNVADQSLYMSKVSDSINADLVRKINSSILTNQNNKNIENTATNINLTQNMLDSNIIKSQTHKELDNNSNILLDNNGDSKNSDFTNDIINISEKLNDINNKISNINNMDMDSDNNTDSNSSILNKYSIFDVDYNLSNNNDEKTLNNIKNHEKDNSDESKNIDDTNNNETNK